MRGVHLHGGTVWEKEGTRVANPNKRRGTGSYGIRKERGKKIRIVNAVYEKRTGRNNRPKKNKWGCGQKKRVGVFFGEAAFWEKGMKGRESFKGKKQETVGAKIDRAAEKGKRQKD